MACSGEWPNTVSASHSRSPMAMTSPSRTPWKAGVTDGTTCP